MGVQYSNCRSCTPQSTSLAMSRSVKRVFPSAGGISLRRGIRGGSFGAHGAACPRAPGSCGLVAAFWGRPPRRSPGRRCTRFCSARGAFGPCFRPSSPARPSRRPSLPAPPRRPRRLPGRGPSFSSRLGISGSGILRRIWSLWYGEYSPAPVCPGALPPPNRSLIFLMKENTLKYLLCATGCPAAGASRAITRPSGASGAGLTTMRGPARNSCGAHARAAVSALMEHDGSGTSRGDEMRGRRWLHIRGIGARAGRPHPQRRRVVRYHTRGAPWNIFASRALPKSRGRHGPWKALRARPAPSPGPLGMWATTCPLSDPSGGS